MPQPPTGSAGTRDRKAALRGRLRAARSARDRTLAGPEAARLAAAVLELPEVRDARVVTAYLSRATEPGTGPLISALWERGTRVLVPVLTPGLIMDWAEYTPDSELAPCQLPGNGSLLEPVGPRLGVPAVGAVDAVIAPGLAVGADGTRMGFGGGCYDRALALLPPGVPVVVLLNDGELLDEVPADPHDQPVTIAVTPTRVVRFPDRRGHLGAAAAG